MTHVPPGHPTPIFEDISSVKRTYPEKPKLDPIRIYRILYKLLKLWQRFPDEPLVYLLRRLEKEHLMLTGNGRLVGMSETKFIRSHKDEELEAILEFHINKEL